MSRYVTQNNKIIQLGGVLGRGGEGTVYALNSNPQYVAKIYHETLSQKKQSKIRLMVLKKNQDILRYTSWPIDIIMDYATQEVVGFVMLRINHKLALHDVYSPAHRKLKHPNLDWGYLLFVARNIAASFESIHEQNYVIGDVNENSIMVGLDSTVTIIDTDSFQMKDRANKFLCEVGVPNFTAPELQTLPSFYRVERTENQDNFGLALLIFHVLIGGRHPFAGRPLSQDAGNAIEKDIQHYRYAYAPDAKIRGFEPPPQSIPITILPQHIQNMFFYAFTEHGVAKNRPTASQWLVVLDELRQKLVKCKSVETHVYANHLSKCPWCELEQQGLVYFGLTPENWAAYEKKTLPRSSTSVVKQGGWWRLIFYFLLILGMLKLFEYL